MQVREKTTTRLPEEGWLEFRPSLSSKASLQVPSIYLSTRFYQIYQIYLKLTGILHIRIYPAIISDHGQFDCCLLVGKHLEQIEKLGSMMDPADLLVNGSRTLHAVGDEQGILFTDLAKTNNKDNHNSSPSDIKASGGVGRRLRLISLDAGLVSPGPAAENMDLYAFPGVPTLASAPSFHF